MLIAATTPATLEPDAALRSRLIGFTGFLHANGFSVSGSESGDVLETAARVGILDPQILRWSLKALLCGRASEWRRYDDLFDAYFMPPNKRVFVEGYARNARRRGPVGALGTDRECPPDKNETKKWEGDNRASRYSASHQESVASTDFKDLTQAEQVQEIEALMRRLARRLKHLQLRREARFHRGRRLDLQRTIRQSVGCGGTPFRLAWKEHRRVRPRLVLLLDVSRSMGQYSFFHLRLARALSVELADVHCFIFHTRITGVSEALRDPDPWRAQERMHLLASGWGGGTRIGESLHTFTREYAPRLVHSRTGIIVVSDGYDTGEPERLASALIDLRRRARRIVWLNPLASRPGFAPVSRGMQAALPYLDLLAPGADLTSIEYVLPQIIEALA